jgi:hypothetical protein
MRDSWMFNVLRCVVYEACICSDATTTSDYSRKDMDHRRHALNCVYNI